MLLIFNSKSSPS